MKHYRKDSAPNGKWIERINEDDLPKAIKEVLKAEYEEVELVAVEQVNHGQKGLF